MGPLLRRFVDSDYDYDTEEATRIRYSRKLDWALARCLRRGTAPHFWTLADQTTAPQSAPSWLGLELHQYPELSLAALRTITIDGRIYTLVAYLEDTGILRYLKPDRLPRMLRQRASFNLYQGEITLDPPHFFARDLYRDKHLFTFRTREEYLQRSRILQHPAFS